MHDLKEEQRNLDSSGKPGAQLHAKKSQIQQQRYSEQRVRSAVAKVLKISEGCVVEEATVSNKDQAAKSSSCN